MALHALIAATCALLVPQHSLRPSLAARCAPLRAALDITDIDGDKIRFDVADGALQLIVEDEMYCEAVQSLEYATSDGRVRQDEDGEFQLPDGPQRAELSQALRTLAESAGVAWIEVEEMPELEELDEDAMEALLEAASDVVLPPKVAMMLDIDDELREQEPGARVLWSRLLQIYPDAEAAEAAVLRNSALVMPYLNKPAFIDGSWRVLCGMMPEEDALVVVTKNPGILASNPAGLAMSDAETIKRAAGFVEGADKVFDATWRKLWPKPWKE